MFPSYWTFLSGLFELSSRIAVRAPDKLFPQLSTGKNLFKREFDVSRVKKQRLAKSLAHPS